MKNIYITITIVVLLVLGITKGNSQNYFLNEGFETGELPEGWTDDIISGEREWRYENGGYAAPGTTFKHPPSAKVGNYNALFQDESTGPESRLFTPKIDLRTAIKAELSFWHAQEKWGEDVDELKVYYRPDSISAWVLLEEYINSTSDWVQRIILLPNEAKTQYFQLAFQAKSKWGWGVCIDEVVIEEKGILPRKVETLSVKQSNGYYPTSSEINPTGFIAAFVSGNDGTIPINSIQLNYTGTDISDVTNVSLYYTRDSVFSVSTPIQSETTVEGNTITVTAPEFSLQTGDNIVWICFDISESATHGNISDYTYSSNSIDLGGTTFPSTAQNPSGKGTIEESILFNRMETTEGWTLTNDWEFGVPTGVGSGDPEIPYSGNWVLATNLDGNYPSNIVPISPHTATSQSANAKFYQNIKLRYKRWLNIDFFDKTSISVSDDNGDTWNQVWFNNSSFFDRTWQSVSHNISSYATRKENLKIRFSIDTTNTTLEYGGWNIDNFAITGDYIAQDVGILNMVAPIQECGLTDTETVKVTVKNFGGETVNTPFDVGYSLNNGVTWEYQTYSSPITSEQQVEFTFTVPANFSNPGLKYLKFKTILTGDEDATNDVYSKLFYVFPTVSYPYLTSFETSTAHWYPTGTNSTWQWGNPSGTVINKASDGTKAWVTSLNSVYKNEEFSFLESPCYNLSAAEYPILAFDYMLDVEEGVDGFSVEYSTDGGLSWAILPEHVGYANNWFDTEPVTALGADGWSVNKTEYITAKNLLPDDAKVDGLKFRFVFASNETDTLEGVAIDNIRVYELPYDVGVISLLSPTDDCEIGDAVKLEFQVENFGYRPLLTGTEIPLLVMVNEGEPTSETILLTDDLLQTETVDFETANNYNLFAAQWHDIVAYTNFTEEDNLLNDTLETQVEVYGLPGYTLGPDIGTTDSEPFDPVIVLDAGEGYTTAGWTFDWSPGGEVTQTIDVTTAGTYSVDVVNERSCPASDEITVWLSDKDVGVTSTLNLADACEQPAPFSPQVTLKNFGPGIYGGVENFPVVVAIDGVEVLEENYTPANGWGVDATFDYTFTGTIDLSEAKTYEISIYTKLAKDLVKTNDTTNITVTTFGLPEVEMLTREIETPPTWTHFDSISTLQADSLLFMVEDIFDTYKWERKIEGTSVWVELGATNQLDVSTIVGNQLISAWYRITVTDVNGCGTALDSTYVNAKDLGVYSIDSPLGSICYSPEGILFSMTIENYGQDTYPIGSHIDATCITPAGTQEVEIVTEDNLAPGGRIVVEFPELVDLIVGDNFVRLSTSIDGDPNPTNDFKEMLLNVKPSPTVSIEPDTLYKIFREDTYEISPTYSADCISYEWQDFTTDSLYYLWGEPLYDEYKVVTENSEGCSASDSLVVISNDLAITAIKAPVSACELGNDLAVTFTLKNNGNKGYSAGEIITVNLTVNGASLGSEAVNLATDLNAGESVDITLTETLDLETLESADILVEIETVRDEVFYDNNILNKNVYASGFPTPTLGEDRDIHAYEEILDPGYYDAYLWSNDSIDQAITVTETGTYSVTVTDFAGCQGSAEVTLTFYEDDLSVVSLDEPTTGCNLSNAEPVKITIQNTGNWTIPADSTIEIGFTHNEITYSENYTFTQPFAPNATKQISLTNTIDLSARKLHSITAWVNLSSDMVPENNSIEAEVEAYQDITVNFESDTIYIIGPYVLDPGGFYEQLWSTGATSDSIIVEESGTYWIQVENEQGCTDADTVVVLYTLPDLKVESIQSPVSDCSLSSVENVTAVVKNLGEYTFPAADSLFLTLWVNDALAEADTIILSTNLSSSQTLTHSFSKSVNMSAVGEYNLSISAVHKDDNNTSNDTAQFVVNNWGYPDVSLGDDFTAFWGDSPVLDAGNPGSTYLWSTEETTQTITISEPGTYSVTVTDENGCESSDEINVTFTDPIYSIAVTELISPYNVCREQLLPVEVTMTNDCEFEIPAGTQFYISYRVNEGSAVTEAVTLEESMQPEANQGYTFEQDVTLSADTYNISLWTSFGGESGIVNSFETEIYPIPNMNLGPDSLEVDFPHTLTSNIGNVTYLWSNGGTGSYITVTQTGTYWLTVTNPFGCTASDTIYLYTGTFIGTIPGSEIEVNVFPNPVDDILFVKVLPDKPMEVKFELISPLGRKVYESESARELVFEDEVDVSSFESGMYFVRISTPEGQIVVKVIVE